MPWPPQLSTLKADMGLDLFDSRDDDNLQAELDAAVALVERDLIGDFDFSGNPVPSGPVPTADVVLGTVRLARRWFERRNSPNGLLDLGDLGATRVPTVDPDIERMLGVGRWRRPMV